MFEKLLSLLLHAKGGAVATVFVLGTTGALVTATVDAGVTTITITQPSSTTTGSETTPDGSTTNTTVTDTILALFNRTNGDEDPTATATGNGCSDEAHRINTLVKEINAEFKLAHQTVATLSKAARTDAAKKAAKDADKTLKDDRREAVKTIHATRDCPKGDDDEDVAEDEDADEDEDTAATDTSVAFSGTDPEAVADLAISAMKQVVTDLTTKLAAQTTTNTTTTSDKANPEGKSNKNDNKGEGQRQGSQRRR